MQIQSQISLGSWLFIVAFFLSKQLKFFHYTPRELSEKEIYNLGSGSSSSCYLREMGGEARGWGGTTEQELAEPALWDVSENVITKSVLFCIHGRRGQFSLVSLWNRFGHFEWGNQLGKTALELVYLATFGL